MLLIDELVRNLKILRKHKSKGQAEISEMMNYDLSSSLSHVESGRKNLSSKALVKWFFALDIDLNFIIQAAIKDVNFNLIHEAIEKGIDINKVLEEELRNGK